MLYINIFCKGLGCFILENTLMLHSDEHNFTCEELTPKVLQEMRRVNANSDFNNSKIIEL